MITRSFRYCRITTGAPSAPWIVLLYAPRSTPPRTQIVSPGFPVPRAPDSAVARSHGRAVVPWPEDFPVGATKCDRGTGAAAASIWAAAATANILRENTLQLGHDEHVKTGTRAWRLRRAQPDWRGRSHAPHRHVDHSTVVSSTRHVRPPQMLHTPHLKTISRIDHPTQVHRYPTLLARIVDHDHGASCLIRIGTYEDRRRLRAPACGEHRVGARSEERR